MHASRVFDTAVLGNRRRVRERRRWEASRRAMGRMRRKRAPDRITIETPKLKKKKESLQGEREINGRTTDFHLWRVFIFDGILACLDFVVFSGEAN